MKALKSFLIAGGVLGLALALMPGQAQAQRSGVEAWVQTCGNCHAIQPANRYTAGQWESIVGHMAQLARLSDAESAAILQFLQGGARQLIAAEQPEAEGVLVASTATILPPLPDSVQDYKDNCVACHGEAGAGDGPAAVAFDPRPADFASADFQASRTDEELIESVTNGKGGMPGFASQFTAEQIQALVQYVRSLGPQQ